MRPRVPTALQVLGLLYIAWLVHSYRRFLKAGMRAPRIAPAGGGTMGGGGSVSRILSSCTSSLSSVSAAGQQSHPPSPGEMPNLPPFETASDAEVDEAGVTAPEAGASSAEAGEAGLPGGGGAEPAARVKPELLQALQRRIAGEGASEGVGEGGRGRHGVRRRLRGRCGRGGTASVRTPAARGAAATRSAACGGLELREAALPSPRLSTDRPRKSPRKSPNPGRWVKKRAGEFARAVTGSGGGRPHHAQRFHDESLPRV